MAKKKFFEHQNSYTYNDKSIKVNAEILDKYTNILDALNIKNDGDIYITTIKRVDLEDKNENKDKEK